MPTMPSSYIHSIHLSPQHASLAEKTYPIHHLEEEHSITALQTSSADRFSPRSATDHAGATRRRNPSCFNEAFERDDFRMYDYKVRRCMRGRSHDWTDCPFAHPGEKARRRDPRKIHYSGSPCPDFRKGSCLRGDACEYAHGVFECWLHPAKYRTQLCKDGKGCTRRVCFFAHSMQQLRHVAEPVEESLMESVSMVDTGLENQGRVLSMVDSSENAMGLPLQTNSSEDCLSAIFLPANSPCCADSTVGLSSFDGYANVGSIAEMLSMLTLSSQSVSSSSFDTASTLGLSSNNVIYVPAEVHPPSPNFITVAPGASDALSATYQNESSPFARSFAPAIFSPASRSELGLSSSNSYTTCEHLTYADGSLSQQAAVWQTFLMHEGYNGGGESTFSVSADEFSDTVHYGGYGDAAILHGYPNGVSKSGGLTNQWALLRKQMYEVSSHNAYGSYGLSSPTSTLAGPLHPSPFSSPPLSPLSTPSSETCNVFSSRGHPNVHIGDTSPKVDVCIPNVNELKHRLTEQQSLHSYHGSQLPGHRKVNTVTPLCSEPLSFSQSTSVQNKWITSGNNWDFEDTDKFCVAQLTFDDMQHRTCGRFEGESAIENAMPDLGWVHELVM